MAQKKGYDVLRFIEHGKGSYISSTYVEGVTLIQWLSETPQMKKNECITMIQEIAKQLELLHKSKGNPVYQYVNPYCIVISEEKNIYLIDMKAESSTERLRKMQSRKIRERFLPPEDPFYQNSSVKTDLFGFGRTLQYMMAAVRLTKPLSKREERQLKNVISRCLSVNSKKSYDTVNEVRKHLPHVKDENQLTKDASEDKKSSWKKAVVLLLLLIVMIVAGVLGKQYLDRSRALPELDTTSEFNNLSYEIYESSLQTSDAEDHASLESSTSESGNLKVMEQESAESDESDLFKQLAKAQSLETLGRYLEAADLYEEILISLVNVQEKELLYEKTASLYMKLGNYDKAYEVLEFGMSELLPSDYLWQCFLNLLTNNEDIEADQKVKIVNEFVESNQEYGEQKYKKLLEETDFYQNPESSIEEIDATAEEEP